MTNIEEETALQSMQLEIEKINPSDLFTANEVLDSIQMYDATV